MSVIDEKDNPKFFKREVEETASYFYWNIFKQNVFWSCCILIPASIVFSYFAYEYVKGGFITRWEMSKIMTVAFFTMLPAGMLLNRILYYHAYNLILNLGNNFFTPYRLGKEFDTYFSESIGFFFKIFGPFLIFIAVLYYTQQYFNPLLWCFLLIFGLIFYEISCCTYGLSVVASASHGYRRPRDWSFDSAITFFNSHKGQVISYAIVSFIGSVIFITIGGLLIKASILLSLLFSLFAGSFFIIFRAALHTKLLENTDWIVTNHAPPKGDAMLGEFFKKNYMIISSTIALTLVLIGYSNYQNSKYSDGRLVPESITPIAREEGVLDYTLIDWIFSDKKYFEHWVLRFPEGASISLPKDTGSNNYYNSRLTLYLKMPAMSFLPNGEERYDKDVTRVSVNAGHLRFNENETGFADDSHELNCVREKEIAQGFFQMRDASAAEKEANNLSIKGYSRNKCGISDKDLNFAYYDEADNLLAKGNCVVSDIFKSDRASCDFRFWLPQRRRAYVDLAPKYLGEFPAIYKKIVTTLNDATVVDHSTNLKWRPSSGSQKVSVIENKETVLSSSQTNELTGNMRVALPGCEIPKIGENSKLVLIGAYDGAAFSNATVLGQDVETTAEEIFIKEGTEPLYLVITSLKDMIWGISGATNRISNIVLSNSSGRKNGTIGSGVTGVDKSKVSFLRNPEFCLSYFRKANSTEAAQANGVLQSLTGRNVDQVIGIEEMAMVNASNNLNDILLRRFPSMLIKFDPGDIVSELPAELYEVLPGEAGLFQLVREGKIERIRRNNYRDEYWINKKIRFPTGLYGADSVTFYISEDVPRPIGSPGHSKVCSVEFGRDIYSDRLCDNWAPER